MCHRFIYPQVIANGENNKSCYVFSCSNNFEDFIDQSFLKPIFAVIRK